VSLRAVLLGGFVHRSCSKHWQRLAKIALSYSACDGRHNSFRNAAIVAVRIFRVDRD
jgi:hypothetical protein